MKKIQYKEARIQFSNLVVGIPKKEYTQTELAGIVDIFLILYRWSIGMNSQVDDEKKKFERRYEGYMLHDIYVSAILNHPPRIELHMVLKLSYPECLPIICIAYEEGNFKFIDWPEIKK